jgi:sn1-specific diacylglycerol lipase
MLFNKIIIIDTLFDDDKYRLTSIGLEHARLCYSNFTNDIIATPYSIVIDDKMKTIVITVRGTRSLEDLVVDLQFTPESLEKVGRICGFDGAGHWCHKGFLARSNWIYNDIKRTKVLNTLYLETSPYNPYPLVLCGHSLGAGCASILSLMLRPAFPSLHCFTYEPRRNYVPNS